MRLPEELVRIRRVGNTDLNFRMVLAETEQLGGMAESPPVRLAQVPTQGLEIGVENNPSVTPGDSPFERGQCGTRLSGKIPRAIVSEWAVGTHDLNALARGDPTIAKIFL
jgi:hypothetical protein